jgi:hypothetical protein
MSGRMKRGLTILSALLVLVVSPAAWLEGRYRWDLSSISRLPSHPQLPPPPNFTVIPIWHELGGVDDPSMPAVYPWRVDLHRQLPSPAQPGLLAARYVAWAYLCEGRWDQPCRSDGSASERQVQALTIWLSRNWTPREVLGVCAQLGQQ